MFAISFEALNRFDQVYALLLVEGLRRHTWVDINPNARTWLSSWYLWGLQLNASRVESHHSAANCGGHSGVTGVGMMIRCQRDYQGGRGFTMSSNLVDLCSTVSSIYFQPSGSSFNCLLFWIVPVSSHMLGNLSSGPRHSGSTWVVYTFHPAMLGKCTISSHRIVQKMKSLQIQRTGNIHHCSIVGYFQRLREQSGGTYPWKHIKLRPFLIKASYSPSQEKISSLSVRPSEAFTLTLCP